MNWRRWSSRYYWPIIAFDFSAAGALALLFAPSLATPIIGATTALLVAFVAYPWQKQQDNNIRVLEEKRKAYQLFMISVNKLEGAFHLPKRDPSVLDEVFSAHNVLALYADKVVLDAAWGWVEAIGLRHKFVNDPVGAGVEMWDRPVKDISGLEDYIIGKEFWLVKRMRMELLGETEEQAGNAIGRRYDTLRKYG